MECVVGGTTSQFTYGPDGLRRSMTVDNGSTVETTHYLLDGQSVIMELQDVNSDGNFFDPSPPHSADAGEVTALYAAGPRGIEFKIDAGGNRRWYLYDGLGSVLAEVDDNGNMTAQRKYDVYGAMRSGDAGSGSQKFCGVLGHSTEPSTGGLIYMRARWYDPSVGRFVSEDPEGDGTNWYIYGDDNPVSRCDYTGLASLGENAAATGVAAWISRGGIVNLFRGVNAAELQKWIDNGMRVISQCPGLYFTKFEEVAVNFATRGGGVVRIQMCASAFEDMVASGLIKVTPQGAQCFIGMSALGYLNTLGVLAEIL